MFKIQTDNHNFRRIVATDKKYILRKMSLKFQKSHSDISCKIAFYTYFCCKLELFGVKRLVSKKNKWLNKVICFNFLKH